MPDACWFRPLFLMFRCNRLCSLGWFSRARMLLDGNTDACPAEYVYSAQYRPLGPLVRYTLPSRR